MKCAIKATQQRDGLRGIEETGLGRVDGKKKTH